jgi:hypothetical protein
VTVAAPDYLARHAAPAQLLELASAIFGRPITAPTRGG